MTSLKNARARWDALPSPAVTLLLGAVLAVLAPQANGFFQKGNEYALQPLASHFAKPQAAGSDDLTLGRDAGRVITLEKLVACSPERAYALWSTAAGLKSMFAPDARVEARPGGEFTIVFNPAQDPQATSHGSGGARVLKAVPGREFAFEWPVFVARDDIEGGPPRWPEQRNRRPLPTWVHLTFEPMAQEAGRTRVTLAAKGFQVGEQWDASYAYFTRAWGMVLGAMAATCEQPAK